MPSALDLLLDAADKAAGPHTGDGGDDDLDALGLEEVAATTVSEGGAIFVDGGTVVHLLCCVRTTTQCRDMRCTPLVGLGCTQAGCRPPWILNLDVRSLTALLYYFPLFLFLYYCWCIAAPRCKYAHPSFRIERLDSCSAAFIPIGTLLLFIVCGKHLLSSATVV